MPVLSDEEVSGSVVVDIMGGLGNQMFQYAAGKALSLRLGVPLHLFPGFLQGDPLRSYALDIFSLPDPSCDNYEEWGRWFDVFLWARKRRRFRKKRGESWRKKQRIVREPHFHYWDGFETLGPGVILNGNWQSPKYFAAFKDEIKRLFAFRELSGDKNRDYARAIGDSLAVAVHVRRTDYAHTKGFAVVGKDDYYGQACKLMAAAHPDATFFIFSDAPAEAEAIFSGWLRCTVVDTGSQESDMHLMTLCKHHVIGNSTFSWWGAWLADNPDGLVTAPRYWFPRERLLAENIHLLDLIPSHWVIV